MSEDATMWLVLGLLVCSPALYLVGRIAQEKGAFALIARPFARVAGMSRRAQIVVAVVALMALLFVSGVPIPGRYQLHTGPSGTFKFDAWTGKTWELVGGWEPVEAERGKK